MVRRLTRPRLLILLAVLLSLGIGALFMHAIWTMRQDQWGFATRTNANLAQTLAQAIHHTLDSFDQSIKGVVSGMEDAQAMALAPPLSERALFDHSLAMPGMEGVLVLNLDGEVLMASGPSKLALGTNVALEALGLLRAGQASGLHVGTPIHSPFSGMYVLPLSRPYHGVNGSPAGVVVGFIRLQHFNELFASSHLGAHSGINLFLLNGTVVVRFPYDDRDTGKSLAGTENMRRLQSATQGSFSSRAVLDGVLRTYAFHHVAHYPLVINVAQSVDEVLADWRRSAVWLGIFALVLMAACIGLAVLSARELEQRQAMGAELQQARHDLQTILDNLPSLVSYWDTDLHNRFANRATELWFGITPEQLRGMPAATLLGPRDYAKVQPYLERALQGETQTFERRMTDAHGQQRHTYITYTPDIQQGKVRGLLVQSIDISERKRMEDELFEEKERIRLTLKSIGDAVICTNAEGKITYLNPVAARMTGWSKEAAIGQDIDRVVPLHLNNGQLLQPSPLHQALASGLSCGPTRGVVLQGAQGQRYDVEESASPIIDRHGQRSGAVMVLHDMTETLAMTARMARLAQYDALTDLPNRLLLQDRASHALAQARRDGRLLAVIYLDLDGFKQVNDCMGHEAGDQLLVEFAQRLKTTVRESDTVCRQGGDEFVLLLPGLDDVAHIDRLAHKILATCHAPFLVQGGCAGKGGCIGISGGVALFPQHGNTFELLARHADEAMYAAKRAGRGRFYLYQGEGLPPSIVTPRAA
jgi:diguanylate cyclase